MRAPITDKHLLEMMWERFPEIMKRGIEQPAQQEPVAWVCEGSEPDEKHGIDYWPGDVDDLPIGTQLYTSPQRTWVGLTDEEIEQSCVPLGAAMLSFTEVARAIEATLRNKNEDRN